jgi:4,5-dihydroxyphthalate decarboxylase
MVGGREFDVAELSASEYISLHGAGDCPFVAIPVFPSRVFRHGYIFVNTRCGIRAPKDLEGRRVGLPLYTQTAAIWARGHLQHQFGVDLSSISWVQGAVEKAGTHGRPHAPPLLAPVRIEQNDKRRAAGRALGARRDRCAHRLAQAGIARPPSRRGPPISRLPGARAPAL